MYCVIVFQLKNFQKHLIAIESHTKDLETTRKYFFVKAFILFFKRV